MRLPILFILRVDFEITLRHIRLVIIFLIQNVGLYSPSNQLDEEEDSDENVERHWLMSLESCQLTAFLSHSCVIVLDELRSAGE